MEINLLLNWFYKLINVVTWITKIVLAVLMSIIVLNVSADVFFRYVLVAPLNWSSQLAKYLMVWVAFLGASLAFREAAHINTDVILRMLGENWRTKFAILSYFGVIVFQMVVIIWGLHFAYGLRRDMDPLLGISMVFPFLAVPVGSICMLLQTVWVMIETARGRELRPQ